MSPTHSDSPPTPVAGVGEGDGSKDGVRRSRAVPQTPREGVRTELRPSDPSLRSELLGDGVIPTVQVLKGVPSWKTVAPGGQGSPERRFAGTTSKAQRGASQGTGSGGLTLPLLNPQGQCPLSHYSQSRGPQRVQSSVHLTRPREQVKRPLPHWLCQGGRGVS